MGGNVYVYELKEATTGLVEPINRLLRQLSSSPHPFTVDSLEAIVNSANSHLFIAEADGAVSGMLTLCDYLAPTGRKMWIEDVVVDEAARGRSIGRLLVNTAIEYAKNIGPGSTMRSLATSMPVVSRSKKMIGLVIFSFMSALVCWLIVFHTHGHEQHQNVVLRIVLYGAYYARAAWVGQFNGYAFAVQYVQDFNEEVA